MYLVVVVVGLESHHIRRSYFDDEQDARDFYDDWVKKSPLRASFYELVDEVRNF